MGRCVLLRQLFVALLMFAVVVLIQPAEPVRAATFDCATITDIPAAECASLKSLYDNTNGDSWIVLGPVTEWGTNNLACSWWGVTCSGSSVIEIDTAFINNLSGNFDTVDLSGLSNLQRLSITGYTNLTGSIPTNWDTLTNLQEIDLISNNLTGPIPTNWGGLTNLQIIDLGYNELTGTIPTNWDGLTNLRFISLSGNNLIGPIPTNWDTLTNLEFITLGWNQLNGTIPTNWGGLTNLGVIDLGVNQLTGPLPTNWNNLTSLGTINLQSNQLTGHIPNNWNNLTSLVYLLLPRNQLDGPIPTNWDNLTSLQCLDLSNNQLTGTIPTNWNNLTNLELISLLNNQLTGTIPTNWDTLTNLEAIGLGTNQLTGTIPTNWGGLTQLRSIVLENNQLDGPIPTNWGGLPTLYGIQLSNNQLTGPIPANFSSITTLSELRLDGNQLNSTVPDLQATRVDYFVPGSSNGLSLCGGGNVIDPSGDAGIDGFAETYDQTGWTAAAGCTAPPAPVAASGGGGGGGTPAKVCNISIDLTADPSAIRGGDSVSWMGVITNPGPDDCIGATVTGTMPGEFSITRITATRGIVSQDGQYLSIDLGTMKVGDRAEIVIETVFGGYSLPEGAAGQSAGQQFCLTELVLSVQDTACVTLFPDALPATGGEPVRVWNWWWLTAGLIVLSGGLWAIHWRETSR